MARRKPRPESQIYLSSSSVPFLHYFPATTILPSASVQAPKLNVRGSQGVTENSDIESRHSKTSYGIYLSQEVHNSKEARQVSTVIQAYMQ